MAPHPNYCTFVHGVAVRFLHLLEDRGDTQKWQAETLFIAPSKTMDVTIRTGEKFRPLHG
jgi:hypothetical protein